VTKKATPRVDSLLDRIEGVCINKAALARSLGVSPTHIKKWITQRKYEPGGEVTLAMLEWVQAEEGKAKRSPGRAATRPEPKTQLRRISHEKPKSGRKKR
jgi:uncharacterized protein YjcR